MNEPFIEFFSTNRFELAVTLVVLILYLIVDRITTPKLEEGADQGRFKEGAASGAINIARLVTAVLGVLILAIVWGINFRTVLIFATTTFTLLGVALFASWSILSHVTSYFIILLHPSFKRGTFIRIIDVDNYAEGYISELTMFNTKLVTENREVIVYPNNLLLSRPSLINPRDRLDGIGKLKPVVPQVEQEQ